MEVRVNIQFTLLKMDIERIHKWRLSNYSFVFVLTILTSLTCTNKIKRIFTLNWGQWGWLAHRVNKRIISRPLFMNVVYREDNWLQRLTSNFFWYSNLPTTEQKNPLFRQPIRLWLAHNDNRWRHRYLRCCTDIFWLFSAQDSASYTHQNNVVTWLWILMIIQYKQWNVELN